ncbi:MAG: hypothetical protein ACYSUS_09475 [Planctomycetota bacterium]|jgi:hypothetical protein
MRNYISFIAIAGLLLAGNIQAGISLNTSLSLDPILMSRAAGFGAYAGNSRYAEENELSAEEAKYLKSPFCLSEFVSENHTPERTCTIDWAGEDEARYLSDMTVGGEWINAFFNLDSVPVFWSANDRNNRGTPLPETIYRFHNRISSQQFSGIMTFYSMNTGRSGAL